MSKNTLLSELINYVSANSSGNVTVAAPTSGLALDVNGTGRFTGQLTLGSTITNGTFTYTLPSATGTLALTSSLGSYVPYTGATASVNLGTNDLTSRYIVANGGAGLGGVINIKQDAVYLPLGNGYSSIASSFTTFDFFGYTGASTYKNFSLRFDGLTNNTLRTLTIPDASGTIALTSNLSAYLPLSGGTLTGALSGTSASFSSTITSTNERGFRSSDAVNGGSAWLFGANTGRYFISVNGGVNALIIENTGAATFSSSVRAVRLDAYGSGTNDLLFLDAGVNTDFAYKIVSGADDAFVLRRQHTTQGGLDIMSWTYSGNVGIGTNSPNSGLHINSGATRGMRVDVNSGIQAISISPNGIFGIDEPGVGNGRFIINTNGRVGIGTSSPGAKLEVIGDARASSFGLNSDSVFRGGLYPYRFISGTGTDYGVTIFAEGGTGNGNIYFCPGGSATRAATITTGGSLLIGTTSNFSNLRLQVSGRIYTEGIVGYSYNQTSTSGTTSIVDTFIDNNSFGQSAMYMISYGGNPNAGGSGAYKTNYVGYISVATGWSGSNVTRYIRYTPVAQFDAPNVGALSLSVFFFNGSTETASINEQSTAGYYIRLKITGYNTSFVGSEQYVYLTRLN